MNRLTERHLLTMANERRLIDANAAIERLSFEAVVRYPQEWDMGILAGMDILRGAPTVDAVEVVRCKDCKYWTQDDNGYMDDEFHCGNPYGIEGYPEESDYCSRGEKMDGGEADA